MTPHDVLRGTSALCDPRRLRPRPAPRQRVSYSPRFLPTQVTPQAMHTRELSWLLFIHKKTQRPTSRPHKHPPVLCGPLSLAVLSFFLAGWLGLGTAALCAVSGVTGSRRPESPGPCYKVATPRRKLSVKGGILSTDQPAAHGAQHGVQSASRCWVGLPVGWCGVGRSWFQGERCARAASWVCRCFCQGVGELTTVATRSKAPAYPVRWPSSQRLAQDEGVGAAARLRTPASASQGTPGKGQSPSNGWGGCSWLGLRQDLVGQMVQ